MTQEFSLTTEYQLSHASTLQVGYVGILGHHLTDPYWGNQWTSPTAVAPYASIVGQGGVAKITGTESASNYNALQAVFRQRLSAGFELTANYTYSKSLTDDIGFYGVSNIYSGQYYQQNAYDFKSEWGPAGMDTRHNISVTGVYDLPFGTGKMVGSNWNPILNSALGGWRLSGAQVYYSGFPVTVSSPANYSELGECIHRCGAAQPASPAEGYRPLHQRLLRNRGTRHFMRSQPGRRQLRLRTATQQCIRHCAPWLAARAELPEHRHGGLQELSRSGMRIGSTSAPTCSTPLTSPTMRPRTAA